MSMATEEPITKDLESKNQTFNWHFTCVISHVIIFKKSKPFPQILYI